MKRSSAAVWLAAAILIYSKEAWVSGPASLEVRTAHFSIVERSGPSIRFVNDDDELRYHQGEHERLQPELEALGAKLEAALGHAGASVQAAVLKYDGVDRPEVAWSALQSPLEADLTRRTYSPYALQLLRKAKSRAVTKSDPTYDNVMSAEFVLVLVYGDGGRDFTVRAHLAGKASRSSMEQLDEAIGAALPPGRAVRITNDGPRAPAPGAPATETEEGGHTVVRTNRVQVVVNKSSEKFKEESAALARKVAARLEAEIASVKDEVSGDLGRRYEFALKKGGYRNAAEPLGGGFSSLYLAEVAPEIELEVRLRTIESDERGSLDSALTDRMFELLKEDLPGLKALGPNVDMGPADWVLVQLHR